MAQCEVYGNDYDKAFEVLIAGQRHRFDCFECAIHALAPHCAHCGCRIIGRGVEARGRIFCCASCSSREGVAQLKDRARVKRLALIRPQHGREERPPQPPTPTPPAPPEPPPRPPR